MPTLQNDIQALKAIVTTQGSPNHPQSHSLINNLLDRIILNLSAPSFQLSAEQFTQLSTTTVTFDGQQITIPIVGLSTSFINSLSSSTQPTTNNPPVAAAGSDIVLTLPTNSITRLGSGSDSDGSINSYIWSKVSGPSTFTISTPNQAQTSFTGLVEGIYVFRLTVTDNQGSTNADDFTITVNPQASTNPPSSAISTLATSNLIYKRAYADTIQTTAGGTIYVGNGDAFYTFQVTGNEDSSKVRLYAEGNNLPQRYQVYVGNQLVTEINIPVDTLPSSTLRAEIVIPSGDSQVYMIRRGSYPSGIYMNLYSVDVVGGVINTYTGSTEFPSL